MTIKELCEKCKRCTECPFSDACDYLNITTPNNLDMELDFLVSQSIINTARILLEDNNEDEHD